MRPTMILFGSATLVFSLAETFVGGNGASALVTASLLASLLVLMEGVYSV